MKNLTAFVFCLLMAGCGSSGNFYVLAPAGKVPSSGGPGIGVGPVTMADYLVDRPYLVFQSTPTKMETSDAHQWAGDLESNFKRALGSDLGYRRGSGNVQEYPWERESELSYQVAVDVKRFHGTSEGDAVLEASWRLYSLPDSRLIASGTTTLNEPLSGDGFERLAEAQSRLVDRFAVILAGKMR
ncbi:membrane integrity-associated transporter subunit PqiC [Luteolibacter sp. AS25]|uniref:PqiC family protein n=1 Tax=Luteolibacter sp. AS25 TaxID=3135776 RepID=UPI00398A7B99